MPSERDNGAAATRPEVALVPIALRPREAAAALGLSRRTLSTITADRTSGIPHCRIGGCVLYPSREWADWIASRIEKPR